MFQEAVEDSVSDQKKGDDSSSNVAKANDTKRKDKITSHPIKIARSAEVRIRTSLPQMFQPVPTTPQAGSTRRAGPARHTLSKKRSARSMSRRRLAFLLKGAVAREVHRCAIEYCKLLLGPALIEPPVFLFVKREESASQMVHFEHLNEVAKYDLIVRRIRCVWRCLRCNGSAVRHRH